MRDRYKLVVIFLSIFILNLIFPIRVAYCQIETENFEVTSYTEVDHGKDDFSVHGNSPYIHGTVGDYPTNDINTGSLNREKGDFKFRKLIPVRETINVTKIIFHQNSSNQGAGGSVSHIGFHFYNGSHWTGNGGPEVRHKIRLPLGAWNTTTIDITILWSSFNKSGEIPSYEFNGLRLWVESATEWLGEPTVILDYAYVTVTYIRTGFSLFPLRLIIGLLGLAIMIISPAVGVREVLKNKNWEMIAGSMALFCIGYALVIVWLTT